MPNDIRFTVDHRNSDGQFLLTGSAVPANASKTNHSGGFAWLTMRPTTLWESGESSGTVRLSDHFSRHAPMQGTRNLTFDQVAFAVCRGGWQKAINKKSETAALNQAINYYEAITRNDISRMDGIERNEQRAKRLLRSYAPTHATKARKQTRYH